MNKALIYIAENYAEAHMIEDSLNEIGIHVMLSGEHLTAALGELPAHILFTRIYVEKKDYKKAIKYIDQYKQTLKNLVKKEVDCWKCNHCNEMIPGNFTNCWKCNKEN